MPINFIQRRAGCSAWPANYLHSYTSRSQHIGCTRGKTKGNMTLLFGNTLEQFDLYITGQNSVMQLLSVPRCPGSCSLCYGNDVIIKTAIQNGRKIDTKRCIAITLSETFFKISSCFHSSVPWSWAVVRFRNQLVLKQKRRLDTVGLKCTVMTRVCGNILWFTDLSLLTSPHFY